MDSVTSGFARIFRARALFVFAGLALTACGQPNSPINEIEKRSAVIDAEDTGMTAEAAPEEAEEEIQEPVMVEDAQVMGGSLVAGLWNSKHPKDGPQWTEHTYNLFASYGQGLLTGVKDIKSFCPNYAALSTQQKYSFWTYLVTAITKYESGYDPTNRYKESTMGIDPITKQRVYSEGLLQLSYQDSLHYSYCNEFSWAADRTLAARDPRKTILDPYKNLNCGVRILISQVNRKHVIGFGSGNYWSTLKTGSSHSQLKNIQKLTKQIAFCR